MVLNFVSFSADHKLAEQILFSSSFFLLFLLFERGKKISLRRNLNVMPCGKWHITLNVAHCKSRVFMYFSRHEETKKIILLNIWIKCYKFNFLCKFLVFFFPCHVLYSVRLKFSMHRMNLSQFVTYSERQDSILKFWLHHQPCTWIRKIAINILFTSCLM